MPTQAPRLPMDMIDLPVPPDLAPWVERVSWLNIEAFSPLFVLAGARAHLCFVAAGEAWLDDGSPPIGAEPLCWGPQLAERCARTRERGLRGLLVKLAGGAIPAVLGVHGDALVGRFLPLARLWPWLRPLAAGLTDEALRQHVMDLLRQALARHATPLLSPSQCRTIMQLLDLASVASAAESLALSRVTLERQVRRAFGITPKQLARIQRFYRTLPHLAAFDAASAAAEAGYFDQSHMIAEFRSLAGMTPRELQRYAAEQPVLYRLYDAGTPAPDNQAGR